MRDFEIVAGVFVAVFIIGIGVGVIAMFAMSALNRHRDNRQRDLGRRTRGVQHNPSRPRDLPPDADDPRRPQWPNDGGFEN